jgi:hypothetical protein
MAYIRGRSKQIAYSQFPYSEVLRYFSSKLLKWGRRRKWKEFCFVQQLYMPCKNKFSRLAELLFLSAWNEYSQVASSKQTNPTWSEENQEWKMEYLYFLSKEMSMLRGTKGNKSLKNEYWKEILWVNVNSNHGMQT